VEEPSLGLLCLNLLGRRTYCLSIATAADLSGDAGGRTRSNSETSPQPYPSGKRREYCRVRCSNLNYKFIQQSSYKGQHEKSPNADTTNISRAGLSDPKKRDQKTGNRLGRNRWMLWKKPSLGKIMLGCGCCPAGNYRDMENILSLN
jgi:hypothetical protein